MIDSTSPCGLSGWESSSARIEGGSISGISARPTPRCAGSRPQPPNYPHNPQRPDGQVRGGRGISHLAPTAAGCGSAWTPPQGPFRCRVRRRDDGSAITVASVRQRSPNARGRARVTADRAEPPRWLRIMSRIESSSISPSAWRRHRSGGHDRDAAPSRGPASPSCRLWRPGSARKWLVWTSTPRSSGVTNPGPAGDSSTVQRRRRPRRRRHRDGARGRHLGGREQSSASTPLPAAVEHAPGTYVDGDADRRPVVAVAEDVQQQRHAGAGHADLADDAGLGHRLDAVAVRMVDRPVHPAVGQLVVPVPRLDADRRARRGGRAEAGDGRALARPHSSSVRAFSARPRATGRCPLPAAIPSISSASSGANAPIRSSAWPPSCAARRGRSSPRRYLEQPQVDLARRRRSAQPGRRPARGRGRAASPRSSGAGECSRI